MTKIYGLRVYASLINILLPFLSVAALLINVSIHVYKSHDEKNYLFLLFFMPVVLNQGEVFHPGDIFDCY